jgi:hypothetical protein
LYRVWRWKNLWELKLWNREIKWLAGEVERREQEHEPRKQEAKAGSLVEDKSPIDGHEGADDTEKYIDDSTSDLSSDVSIST